MITICCNSCIYLVIIFVRIYAIFKMLFRLIFYTIRSPNQLSKKIDIHHYTLSSHGFHHHQFSFMLHFYHLQHRHYRKSVIPVFIIIYSPPYVVSNLVIQ